MDRHFRSDDHFDHPNIIPFCSRPFRNLNHMNETLINNHNETVHPDGQVFHLGDAALGILEHSLQLVARLNGHLILIPGNHDRMFSGQSETRQARFLPAYQEAFHQILPTEGTHLTLKDGTQVRLSHFPYQGDSHDRDRYANVRPVDDGTILIHGHTHSPSKITRTTAGTLQIHVGVDAWNYRPVSEDQIIALIATA